MKKGVKKLVLDLLTGPDGETWDWVRCASTAAVTLAFSLQAYVTYHSKTFDLVQFGTGVGLLIGAGAAGMWARKDVELPPEHFKKAGE